MKKIISLTFIFLVISLSVTAQDFQKQKNEDKETGFISKIINFFKDLFTFKVVKYKTVQVASCRTPISTLPAVTQEAIISQAKNVCLGGLITIDGPPILGNIDGLPIIDPVGKYRNNIIASVNNNYLECNVPCTNPYALEIQTCFDFRNPGAPFKLPAYAKCN